MLASLRCPTVVLAHVAPANLAKRFLPHPTLPPPMRIRKLELQGFKSFVDRQTFHFGAGIAGVVGPNGCGKSNVVDAVKWCIGEQSARSLRGTAMADVIFNGSASRPPVGMAEVCITFASTDEPFPGQWARFEEVAVSRRLFRDGTSEYRINQERVRLRDVHDLFLDTGVGARLYSFIEQGQVERIVLSRPEHRRTLVEEAAGISRFKARRAEALDKLEQTDANLDRVSEVADDMGRRLRSLERQVERAARYRRLRAQVRQEEIFLGLARFAALSGDRRALVGDLRAARAAEDAAGRELRAREATLSGVRERIAVADAVVGELRDAFAELEAQRREAESARHYQSKAREDLLGRLQHLEGEVREWTGLLAASQVEVGRLEAEVSELARAAEGLDTRLREAQADLDAGAGLLQALRRRVGTLKDRSTVLLNETARIRAAIGASERTQADLQERLGRCAEGETATVSGLTALRERVADAEAGLAVADDRVRQASQARDLARQAEETARSVVTDAEGRLRETEQARTGGERDLARAEVRLQSLRSMLDSHEGVGEGALAVLRQPGALGTLAEHLDVDPGQLGFVQALLGEALDHVLVEDRAALLRGAAAAEARVGLVPLSDAPADSGLSRRLDGTPEGRRAVARLVAGWRTAEDLAEALDLWQATGADVITRDGSVVRRDGVVFAGRPGVGAAQVVLARRHQHTEAQAVAEAASTAFAALQGAVVGARTVLETARTALATAAAEAAAAEQDWHRCRLAQGEARQRLQLCTGELRQAEGRAAELVAERERVASALSLQEGEAGQARSQLQEREHEQAEVDRQLLESQAALQAQEERYAALRESVSGLTAQRDGSRRQGALLAENLEAGRVRCTEAARRLERSRAETASSQARIAELGQEDQDLARRLQALGEEQGGVRERLEAERTRLERERERLQAAERALDAVRTRLAEATASRTRLDLKLQEVRLSIEGLKEQVERRHEVSLPGLLDRLDRAAGLVLEAGPETRVPLPEGMRRLPEVVDLRITPQLLEDREAITAHLADLEAAREQLKRLGEVNLTALDEYEEVRERWTWLRDQREDLERSAATIRKAIADINRTCRMRFREAYDRIDAEFRALYPRLVGGGEAHLALTDEDDLLETGVEIYARPPGKRMQSLRLLSGGEKAMTAIALIFSIFRVKPSPFCVLDEVDAPLDEGNGARFNDMLREMCELSQFIVVTHNKKTMESVDTLYGVTMPDPGTSRLVTVRISH